MGSIHPVTSRERRLFFNSSSAVGGRTDAAPRMKTSRILRKSLAPVRSHPITMAAGDISMHPTSRSCREFLLAVLEICHHVVMTYPIKEEWDKHQSGFARRWRLSMVARKKLEVVQIEENYSLEEQFSQLAAHPRVLAIMDKDRHLIEAALASDKRVASLDDEVRTYFREHRHCLPELRQILLGESRCPRRRGMRVAPQGSSDRPCADARARSNRKVKWARPGLLW